MTCRKLSDRMPLVAAGQTNWTDAEQTHLERCPDCCAEWSVVELTASVTKLAPRPDPERVSAKVLDRLAGEPPVPARTRLWWLVGGAAAAAAALSLAVLWPRESQPIGPQAAFQIPMTELDSLTQEQLRLVLESIEEPLETPMMNEVPSMMDLDDQQLERVLRSLEG